MLNKKPKLVFLYQNMNIWTCVHIFSSSFLKSAKRPHQRAADFTTLGWGWAVWVLFSVGSCPQWFWGPLMVLSNRYQEIFHRWQNRGARGLTTDFYLGEAWNAWSYFHALYTLIRYDETSRNRVSFNFVFSVQNWFLLRLIFYRPCLIRRLKFKITYMKLYLFFLRYEGKNFNRYSNEDRYNNKRNWQFSVYNQELHNVY